MKTTKRVGIWMDHSTAHIMEFIAPHGEAQIGNEKVEHLTTVHSFAKGEYHMHTKEQHQQEAFYQKLAERITNYGEVLLFGPSQAKDELANLLSKDHQFRHVSVYIHADKMTEPQQQAYVRQYFLTAL